MKTIKLFGFAAALFAMALGTGCEQPGDIITRNFAYITEPSAVGGVAYESTMSDVSDYVDIPFTVNLSDYAVGDVMVTLNVNNAELVEAYNTDKGGSYTAVPQARLKFSGPGVVTDGNNIIVTIPEGKNLVTITARVSKFTGMQIGGEYAVAVKLADIAANQYVEAAPDSWTTLLLPVTLLANISGDEDLAGIPIAAGKYPIFKYVRDDSNFTLQVKNWGALFDDFTVEVWFNSSTWQSKGNQQLFDNRKLNGTMHQVDKGDGSMVSTDEFFVRYGNNVTGSGTGAGSKSSLEIKAFNGAGSDAAIDWPAAEWVHVAVVYKKRDNALIIYRNGEQNQKIDGYPTPLYNGGNLLWQHIGMIGTDGGGASASVTMALRELRFWKVARRAAQIREYMRVGVDPAEEHLVAYWPFNYIAEDVTTTLSSVAEYKGNALIPKAPAFTLYNNSYFSGWGDNVDFSTVQVTLKDGSKSPATPVR